MLTGLFCSFCLLTLGESNIFHSNSIIPARFGSSHNIKNELLLNFSGWSRMALQKTIISTQKGFWMNFWRITPIFRKKIWEQVKKDNMNCQTVLVIIQIWPMLFISFLILPLWPFIDLNWCLVVPYSISYCSMWVQANNASHKISRIWKVKHCK